VGLALRAVGGPGTYFPFVSLVIFVDKMFIPTNGHQLYYEIHGPENAQTVVLLHHGLGSTRAWRKQVSALVEAEYRVIVYDRWGYGASDERPSLDVPGFESDIADLDVLFGTCNLRSVTLLGHSDGGTLALYFAVRYPERVTALVTVAAHIYLERATMEPGIKGILQTYQNDQRFRKGMHVAHGDKADAVMQNWFDSWHTPEALTWDMRSQLGQISCPTLVIQGELDEHATSRHAIDIAEHIPGAELWLVEGAAHMLPQEMPVEFNNKLLDFLCIRFQVSSSK
jgi:pimeloyl-ACP methyl ester carboxylesterase